MRIYAIYKQSQNYVHFPEKGTTSIGKNKTQF